LSAFNALARREHSVQELRDKLSRKFDSSVSSVSVRAVLDDLVAEGLLSDERFSESFVHARIQRGQGPVKIRYELRQKGVSEELLESVINDANCDWLSEAGSVIQRKFGSSPPTDQKEFQRRLRFLVQRGFPQNICYKAVKNPSKDIDF